MSFSTTSTFFILQSEANQGSLLPLPLNAQKGKYTNTKPHIPVIEKDINNITLLNLLPKEGKAAYYYLHPDSQEKFTSGYLLITLLIGLLHV